MSFTVREGMIGGTVTTALRDHESLSMTLTVGEGYFAGKYARWSSGWVETALVMVFSALALLYWALTLRSKPLPSVQPAQRRRTPAAVRSAVPACGRRAGLQHADLPLGSARISHDRDG